MTRESPRIEPGWYKDPADPTTQRWWDGEGWIGDPLPADVTPPPGPPTVTTPARSGGFGIGRGGQAGPAGSAPPGTGSAGTGTAGSGIRRTPAGPGRTGTPPVPGARPPGYRPTAPPQPHGYPLATLGARLVARLIDISLVFLLNVLVNGWFVYQYVQEIWPIVTEAQQRMLNGEPLGDLPESSQAQNLMFIILIIAAALWFAYEVPAVANNGQTPGKRLLGIKVVRLEADQPLGFGRSFRRWNTMGLPTLLWFCFGVGFLLQLIDVLFALFDRSMQQALHDKSAHTAVVALTPHPRKEAPDAPADPS